MSRPPTLSDRLAARERPEGTPLARKRDIRRLLLHWSWEPSALQRGLPPGLAIDTYRGRAWVGISAYLAKGVVPAFLPSILSVSELRAVSVRTYVFDRFSRPGIYLLKVDIARWPAVLVGRLLFGLPCDRASIDLTDAADGSTDLRIRVSRPAASSRFLCRPMGEGQAASLESESLDAFLLERYRIFACDRRHAILKSAAVAHPPSVHRPVELPEWDDAFLRRLGLDRSGRLPEHACCAKESFELTYPMVEVPEADPLLDPSVLGDSAMPA